MADAKYDFTLTDFRNFAKQVRENYPSKLHKVRQTFDETHSPEELQELVRQVDGENGVLFRAYLGKPNLPLHIRLQELPLAVRTVARAANLAEEGEIGVLTYTYIQELVQMGSAYNHVKDIRKAQKHFSILYNNINIEPDTQVTLAATSGAVPRDFRYEGEDFGIRSLSRHDAALGLYFTEWPGLFDGKSDVEIDQALGLKSEAQRPNVLGKAVKTATGW